MREMQRRQQGRFVAGIQCRHKAVEHDQRRVDRCIIGLGLSLVDDRFFLRQTLADSSAKDSHVITAGNLSRLVAGETAAQHCRNEVHPLCVVLHGSGRHVLVGADADMIDPDDVDHFLEAVDVFIEARKEVPDADRAAGPGDRLRMIGG